MTDDTTDDTDRTHRAKTTRRTLLGALAIGGLGAVGAASASDTNVGGGSMQDAISDLQARLYEGTIAERPAPGVDGRYYRVHDPSGTAHGRVYHDDGGSWTRIDLGVADLEANNVDAGTVTADTGVINSLPASYHVHTDGTTIYGEPQDSGLSRVTDTDIESFLETVRDALPPSGNSLEAVGAVYFKAHPDPYPGTLSDYAGIVSGIRYIGETMTHSLPNETNGGTNRPTLPGVVFETDNIAFRTPKTAEVSGSRMDWCVFQDISVVGPGDSTGVGFDLSYGTGNGFVFLDRVSVQKVSDPWKQPLDRKDNIHGLKDINFAKFAGTMKLGRNSVVYGSSALIPANGGKVRNEGRVAHAALHGKGVSNPSFDARNGGVFVACELGKIGGTQAGSQGLILQDGGRATDITVNGDWNDYETPVFINGGSLSGITDQTSSTQSVVMSGTDSVLETAKPPANGIITSSATRPIHNGRYVTPPTLSLGGTDGSISPTDNSLTHYTIKVDAGGSNTNLTGIDTIADIGTRCTLIHTGGENVVLQDQSNSGAGSNGLVNDGRSNITMSNNGELATYIKSDSHWREIGSALNA